ncbi:MAG: hypothetical protein KKE05_04805, partial [Nanoarchaeota archaeon]|nr:hypothetical protein [Nanoarchaeota archaeon]
MDQKTKEKIMDLLVDEKIFTLQGGPFKTSGGLDVPFYIDFRRLTSDPRTLSFICQVLTEEIKNNKIDAIGGIETTGIPFSTMISSMTNKPSFWLRKKIRDHGLLTIIAGKK